MDKVKLKRNKKPTLPSCSLVRWAVLWRSENRLDGLTEHFIFGGNGPILFLTRKKVREWVDEHYNYIRSRKDLRAEPHGWRVPKVVKVTVEVRLS